MTAVGSGRVLVLLATAHLVLGTVEAEEQIAGATLLKISNDEIEVSAGRSDGIVAGQAGRIWREGTGGNEVVKVFLARFVISSVLDHVAYGRIERRLAEEIEPGMGVIFDRPPALRPAPRPERPEADPRFVPIPAGSFDQGCVSSDTQCEEDELPVRRASVPRTFLIAATEITNGQYESCVNQGRCTSPRISPHLFDSEARAHQPVMGVTREQAADYCAFVAARLPSEIEWEYAARGGLAGAVYPWGQAPPSCSYSAVSGARFDDDLGCDDVDAAPVGSFRPNSFGLYDMAGNAWEWVETGPSVTDDVVRGGAWSSTAAALRVSNRKTVPAGRTSANIGFRCVRDSK